MQNRLAALATVALIITVVVSGCAEAQTTPRAGARLTIGDNTWTASPAECSQEQAYRTINIANHAGWVQAVVLLSGERVIPKWVKIRNVDGFSGSFWEGGVGDAQVKRASDKYTIRGSAYGINNNSNPNKVVTTGFTIIAQC